MKNLIFTLAVTILLLASSSAYAGTYYVAKNGLDSNPGTAAQPWLTIQKAANTLVAGDIVNVKAGVYSESVYMPNSGTAGNYITFQNYNSDNVSITGIVQVGYVYNQVYTSYVIVKGFEILGGIDVAGSYNQILGNYIHNNVNGNGIVTDDQSSHNLLRNNRSDSNGGSYGEQSYIKGSYNVFEFNEVSDLQHKGEDLMKFAGYNLVVRNNYFHDLNNGGHNDCFQANGTTDNVLIANNTITGIADQFGMISGGSLKNVTFRSNVMCKMAGGSGMGLNGGCEGYQIIGNVFGNNMDYPVCGSCAADGVTYYPAVIKNNIFYNAGWYMTGGTGMQYYADYNSIYPNASGAPIESHGLLGVNPNFVNPASLDFHLQSNSACINAGTFMTITTSAGSGTQIPVGVARLFTDGNGVADGDLIQLQGQTQTAMITSIDYTNNILTVNQSLTWTNGLGISTPYSGSAPDMGCFEYSSGGGDTQAPSVPTGLTSSSITQTSFTLNWTASTDNVGVTGYEVFKNGASIGTSASASMSVTGLTANTTYSMTVRARDAVPNWSAQSTALIVTTASAGDTQAPSVPTGLTSSSIAQTSFTLNWTASTDNVGVTGYEVFKNGASIGTSASASMSVTGLTASTTYSMTVRARDAVPNWSAQSTALNVTTSASGGEITIEAENFNTQSGGVQTESCSEGGSDLCFITNGSYTVYNNINFGSGATGFQARVSSATIGGNIEIRLDNIGGTLVGTWVVPVTGGWQTWTTVSCSVSGATGSHNLYLKFTGGSGNLFNFNWFKFTPSGGGDTQAPSVPTGLTSSSITQTSFTLSWTASTDNVGVTGYEVFKNGASIGTSASASMSVTGLTANTSYSMTVRARDAVPNWSAQSTALNVTTSAGSDTQAPSVPTGLTSSSITQTSFTLSWTASTDNVGVTGYEVFKNGASIGTSASASMSVTGLTANTSYSMTVRARDAVPNWSAQSTALNVTTLASGAVTSSTTWQSFTVSTQTGTFTAAFDAVPNTANMNGVTGIQNGTATDYPNLACAARFYTTGLIEAINGGDGVYSSSTTVNYSAGTSYHFRLVINVTAHTYSIYVTPNGQGEVTLGTNYAFRSQQAGVTQLTGWSLVAGTGTHTVSNMTFTAGDTQAPSVPTGLTSSSIAQTSFTLNWTASTDNVGVTGYEVFKNGASIGTSASASMSVTGLTASTTYSMTVRARDAVPNWSAQSTALKVMTASASVTSSTTWQSFTRSTQTGTFTAAFDAVPNTANMNGVTGIQNGTATNYPNLACAVRFYTAGKIEAINGGDGVYSSSTTVNYSAGTNYHFRLVINVTAHTYSIYVTPNGQGEVTLGTNYAFRSQQAGVTQLTGWSLVALTGTHTVSNMTFGTSGKISQAQNNESETGNNADVMPSKPVTFSLSQNYPNPFNPTTNIEYRIANTGFVSLKIYDVLGREVSTLVNGQKSIGIYTVQWDASNLPSGVYFSRLTVQTQEGMPIVMTKKILFTK